MSGPIIGPIEEFGAFLAEEGLGRKMQGSHVTVTVPFARERLPFGAARPSAPEIAWPGATVASESASTARQTK